MQKEAIAQFMMSAGVIRHRAELGQSPVYTYAQEIFDQDIYVQEVINTLGLTVEALVNMPEEQWLMVIENLV